MRKIFAILFVFSCGILFSQIRILDSIKQQVQIHNQEDTARAFFLNELAWQYLDFSVDTSEIYLKQALDLSNKINYLNGIIAAKNARGIILRYSNKLDEAIKVGQEVIELRLKYGPRQKLTGAYCNLGSIYILKKDNATALNYLNKGLENAQYFHEKENEVLILSNIGIVYNNADLNELAIETYQKAIAITKQLSKEVQEQQLASIYTNIASIYDKRGLYGEAYKYYKPAYDHYKKENNIRQNSVIVFNLTSNTRNNKDLKGCEFFLKEMEQIATQLNEKDYTASYHMSKTNYLLNIGRYNEGLAEVAKGLALVDTVNSFEMYGFLLAIKADCYKYLKNYKKGLEASDLAIPIITRAGNKAELATLHFGRSQMYRGLGDYKMSFEEYEKATLIRDTLNSESFDTRMATLNSMNKLDKKEKELAVLNSEKEKVSAENKRQTTLLIAGSIVGFLVIVLLIFSLRAYSVKQKDNVLLNEQKKEIAHQKDLVDEKQKEIVDSINYALQIQKTMIANHALVNETVPDSFVYFKPKDIVSGDFYWATKKDNHFYLAVCDSTGHGVPGAFMSLLNINYLNEAIQEKNILKPNQVFDHVRKRLTETISQNGRKDGMDGILLCMEEGSNTITYAAANNSPVLISDNKLVELSCDKMPVGVGEKAESFTEFSFNAKKGDMLYLYTDGYPDQFGGPKGKKFKYKQLEELLLENNKLDVYKQEVVLKQRFEKWIGKLEQVDDVCILGIRLYTNESVYPGAEGMVELEKNLMNDKNV